MAFVSSDNIQFITLELIFSTFWLSISLFNLIHSFSWSFSASTTSFCFLLKIYVYVLIRMSCFVTDPQGKRLTEITMSTDWIPVSFNKCTWRMKDFWKFSFKCKRLSKTPNALNEQKKSKLSNLNYIHNRNAKSM